MSVMETLERCILFTGLPFEAISLIRTQNPVIFVKPGEVLLQQGQKSEQDLYVLLEGEMELRYHLEGQSADVRVESLMPGEILGEIGIFWPHPRIATVMATRSSRLLKVTAEALQGLQGESYGPTLMLNVVCLLSNRIEAMNKKLTSQTQIGLKLALPTMPVTLLTNHNSEESPVSPLPTRPLAVGNLLENSPLGTFLGTVYQEMIGTLLEVRRYQTAQLIFKEGTPSRDALLICSGSVQISRSLSQGEIVLSTINNGELVGEMGLFRGVPRSATARALAPVIALSLPEEFAQQLMSTKPRLASRLLEYTAQLLEKRLILLNELCARMEMLQRLPPQRTVMADLDPQKLYFDYRVLQYLFMQIQNPPAHRRPIAKEVLGLLQQVARSYPDLEQACRNRPLTVSPLVLTEAMEADERLATEIIEDGAFLFTLLIAQRHSTLKTYKDLLERAIDQEQEALAKDLKDGQRLFSTLPREQKLTLRFKILQNLTSLQLQILHVFAQIGLVTQNQEQNLRLSRELMQPFLDQIRSITA